MGRPRKPTFRDPKMLSARIETSDFYKFERVLRLRDHKSLQEMLNLFIVNYISGNIKLEDDRLVEGDGVEFNPRRDLDD